MSKDNIELVRGIYDAAARRDQVTPFEAYAEDVVWDLSNSRRAVLFSKSVFQGHEGVRQVWREALSALAEVDLEIAELIDAGNCVVVVLRERAVGRASGASVETMHLAV